jgi:glycosyltransferase involved in cell wall biosynthesis
VLCAEASKKRKWAPHCRDGLNGPNVRIAVVVPAHNEELVIADCLTSIEVAVQFAICAGHQASIYVACDACTDRTEQIVRAHGHHALAVAARKVGKARAVAACRALKGGAQWLAFTDADPTWLVSQLSLQSDVVCGTVSVRDWGPYGDAMREHFERTYTDADGHAHIHGANLGIAASAYLAAGGFAHIPNSEDVGIVESLENAGAKISWSALPRVVTSARTDYRATAGLGATPATMANSPDFIAASESKFNFDCALGAAPNGLTVVRNFRTIRRGRPPARSGRARVRLSS